MIQTRQTLSWDVFSCKSSTTSRWSTRTIGQGCCEPPNETPIRWKKTSFCCIESLKVQTISRRKLFHRWHRPPSASVDLGFDEIYKVIIKMETCLLEHVSTVVQRPGAHHKETDTMTLISKKNCRKKDASVDADIPIMVCRSDDHEWGSPVLHIDQDEVPIPSKLETIDAQAEDFYCPFIRTMVGIEPSCF